MQPHNIRVLEPIKTHQVFALIFLGLGLLCTVYAVIWPVFFLQQMPSIQVLAGVSVILMLEVFILLQLHPKQGVIEIKPAGFVCYNIFGQPRFFAWRQVRRFWIRQAGRVSQVQQVCFEYEKQRKTKQATLTHYAYPEFTLEELVTFLNENLPTDTSRLPDELTLEDCGQHWTIFSSTYVQRFIVGLSVGILSMLYFWLFGSNIFYLSNHSEGTIHNLEIRTYGSILPSRKEFFAIGELAPKAGQEIKLPSSGVDVIKFTYEDSQNQKHCLAFRRRHCSWRSGDRFEFSNTGIIPIIGNTCKRKNELIYEQLQVNNCPIGEISFDTRTARFTMISSGTDSSTSLKVGEYISEFRKKVEPEIDTIVGKSRVTASLVIQRDGTLSEVKLVQPSYDTHKDNAIINFLQEIAPYPPLPPSFEGSSITLHYEMNN